MLPVAGDTARMSGSEFAELRKQIVSAGLFEKSWRLTMTSVVFSFALLGVSIGIFFVTTNIWIILLNAALLAWIYGRFGLLAHDFGHMQVFQSAKLNDIWGNVSGTVVGLSYDWWKQKHNAHHAHTNHEDMDPDIDIPILAYSESQAKAKRGISRWIVQRQAWFFFPIQLLAGVSLRTFSWLHIFTEETPELFVMDLALHMLHVALYLTIIFSTQVWWVGILFIILHQKLWSAYITSIFAPNHKGMPILEGQTIDFMREQILTARNIRPNPIVDCYYGHLNYQIEHHLFPTLARNRMPAARKIIKNFCTEKKIEYYETSVFRSYVEIIQFMHRISKYAR